MNTNQSPSVPTNASMLQEAAQEVANPDAIIDTAFTALKDDPGALFNDEVLIALTMVRIDDPAKFARYRAKAKSSNNVSMKDFDQLTKPEVDAEQSNGMTRLIEIAKSGCRLCHTADKKAVAIIDSPTGRQVWFVQGEGFTSWLRSEYFSQTASGVSDAALASALGTIQAIGVHSGDEIEVHLRYAKQGSSYVVDLCDDRWRAVKISSTGWEILDTSPVFFTRNDNMRPLPVPEPAGDVSLLWNYANVSEDQRPLALAVLLDSMRPDTAFPVLEIAGEQGSAKSSTQKYFRDLVDPNKVPLRGYPKTVEDIYIAAANSWVVSYENLSRLPNPVQDALCTLSTGGGTATRKHYSNGEEYVLEAKRPVMLNGIVGVVTRPDLIERTVRLDAPRISQDQRRDELDLAAGWATDRGKILGGLFDLFVGALKLLPEVNVIKKQRMADYEKLGEAIMQSNGHKAGQFSDLLGKAVAEGIALSLEVYGVANALLAMCESASFEKTGRYTGTVGGLLVELQFHRDAGDMGGWPKSSRGLSDQLKRLGPALRAQGIRIEFGGKTNKGKVVTVTKTTIASSDDPN